MLSNSGKAFIKMKPLGEHQENIADQRKPLKATLINNQLKETVSQLKTAKTKTTQVKQYTSKVDVGIQSAQVSTVNSADLIGFDDANVEYYKFIAEQGRLALRHTLIENQYLNERIVCLEEELNTSRKELDEAELLAEILKECLVDTEGTGEDTDTKTET